MGPDLSISLKMSRSQRAAEKQVRTNAAGLYGTKFVRPLLVAWDLTSSLQTDNLRASAFPLSSRPGNDCRLPAVCPAPHTQELRIFWGCTKSCSGQEAKRQ